jgi:lipoate-protein ligase B
MNWEFSIHRNISFSRLLEIQEESLNRLRPESGSMLVFAELKPTITLGSRQIHENAQFSHLNQVKEIASREEIDIFHGERGGNETWHGPGQWVGFVVAPLEKFTGDPRGVRKAVCGILNCVLKTVKEYEPDAMIEEGDRMGIWSKYGKIVSVGIKIRGGYITSGFALNCFPHAKSFMGIHPCGIAGASPDFIFSRHLSRERWNAEFDQIPLKILESFTQSAISCA